MKNKINYLFLCFCLVCTASFLTSCSDDDDSESESSLIVGTWANDNNANMYHPVFWTFDSQGNIEVEVYENPSFDPSFAPSYSNYLGSTSGEYTLKDGILTISFYPNYDIGYSGSRLYFVTLTKDHMVLTDKDLDTISFSRK